MSLDNQFTALGPTEIGFQTDGANIRIGAEIAGREVGVRGHCDTAFGVEGTGGDGGVHGRGGKDGVFGEGPVGVRGEGTLTSGVVGKGPVGISGEGTGNIGVGVKGTGVTGLTGIGFKVGVVGETDGNNTFLAQRGVSGKGPVGVTGEGAKVGVIGVAGELGNQFLNQFTSLTGVVGKGPVGISGEGTDVEVQGTGVHVPAEVGVSGKGPVGVRGESNVNSDKSIGVEGTVKRGTGIVGQSEEGNAGSFSSKNLAQIHLEPLSIPTPVGTVPGKGGDLLATKDLEGITTLWFCVGDGDATKAVWKQIG